MDGTPKKFNDPEREIKKMNRFEYLHHISRKTVAIETLIIEDKVEDQRLRGKSIGLSSYSSSSFRITPSKQLRKGE